MVEKALLLTGSSILLILGTLHMKYTFFSSKFQPRNIQAENEMKNTSPKLTRETTMWNAWIGFNASHSLGAIYFGIINIVLVINFFSVVQESLVLSLFNIAILLFYLFLAKRFWFKIPLMGILVSTICFMAAHVLIFLSR